MVRDVPLLHVGRRTRTSMGHSWGVDEGADYRAYVRRSVGGSRGSSSNGPVALQQGVQPLMQRMVRRVQLCRRQAGIQGVSDDKPPLWACGSATAVARECSAAMAYYV